MKKIIIFLALLSSVVHSSEIRNEDIDQAIRNILLINRHIDHPHWHEMIESYQERAKVSESQVEGSLHRMLVNKEDDLYVNRILTRRALMTLEHLGDESSLLELDQLINNQTFWPLKRDAMFVAIILSGYDLQRIAVYMKSVFDKNEKFWTRSLVNRLLNSYKNETELKRKKHLEEVIRKTIKLLEEYEYADWIPKRLEKHNMEWVVNTENSSSKERPPSTPKLNEKKEVSSVPPHGETALGKNENSWIVYLLSLLGLISIIWVIKRRVCK